MFERHLLFYCVFSVLTILYLGGCAPSKQDSWEYILSQGTRADYENYLRRHPDSVYAVEAKKHIERLDYESALQKGSAQAIKSFLEKYPTGVYSDEAHRKLPELVAQEQRDKENRTANAALKSSSYACMYQFVTSYPDSEYRQQVETRLADLSKTVLADSKLLVWKDIGLSEPLDSKRFRERVLGSAPGGILLRGKFEGPSFPVFFRSILFVKADTQSPDDPEFKFPPDHISVSSIEPCFTGKELTVLTLEGRELWFVGGSVIIPVGSELVFHEGKPVSLLGLEIESGSARVEPDGLLFRAGTIFFSSAK
jgi:hypothetical protein